MPLSKTTAQRFTSIDVQLDKIVKTLITGFDRIETSLDNKATKDDMQRVLNLADELSHKIGYELRV
ncbi:hypothetical protein H7Y63_02475 [Polaromonas sp.]|nr:hypothetical protein [Candidatus Saccharibacteria bacterium]